MSRTTALDRIGVGIDTARYGHRVSFLRPDRRPAAPPLTVLENHTVRALYRRLKAKGTRGDVALGHCMTKLVHLAFAVWKTNRPFNPQHYPWEPPANTSPPSTSPVPAAASTAAPANKKAVGHKRDVPATEVVTTADTTVTPPLGGVNPTAPPRAARPRVDYAFLRQQVTMEQVLGHLGWLGHLRGRGHQRRGPCPIHGRPDDQHKPFSVHLGLNLFQCFQAECGAHGNVLDLWAAVHQLPLYEAALHLAETFQLRRNREEKL
jgi:hypothetical protein